MTSFQFLKLEPAGHLQFLCLREDILLNAYYLGSTVLSTLYLAFDSQKEIRLNAPSLTDAKRQDQYWVQASRLLYTYFDPLCYGSFQMHLVAESFLYKLAYSSWAHHLHYGTSFVRNFWCIASPFLVIPNKEMFMSLLVWVASIDRYQKKKA